MTQMDKPTPGQFAETFREVIRVGFNWERFFKEKWHIELVRLDSKAALERCFVPWYIGPNGDEVAYDDEGAVPMSLTDVPKAKSILNEERQADIQNYVKVWQSQDGPIEFATPTYALPNDRYFVLDGNHRLSALTISSKPFVVTLWNVCGPFEPDGLLDLHYWHSKKD